MRTSLKHRVHALLARRGILPRHSDFFGRAGREFLVSLEMPDGPDRRLDSVMALIDDLDREVGTPTREIDARARADEPVALLCGIRGIGRYTTMLVIAEIGDVGRFPTARHLCAWAGLTPTVRSSAGKARLGHISRQGSSILRWALIEATQKAPPAAGRCAPATSGSRSGAARRSPRWRWPGRSSPSATTACATARSVAWPIEARAVAA